MARYILLAIEDNTEADNLIKVLKGEEFPENLGLYGRTEVVGVWFKPTQFCECSQGLQTSRGVKFGSNVHKCGKPIAGQWHHPKNLVKDDGFSSYEQGLYLGIVEPQSGKMPTIDFKARGKALGITR